MRTQTDSRQIDTYRRNGYLSIEGFLCGEELGELRSAVIECVQRMGNRRVARNPELDEEDGYISRVNLQRVNLWKVNQTVRRYLLDPGIGCMLCSLAGIAAVRVWHDQTFFKPPWANATAFHLDIPNWSFFSPDSLQVWIALDDATLQNGCIYYLPGSHKITTYNRNATIGGDVGRLFESYPELANVQPVPVELKAGGAIVHNGLTVHGAGANMSPQWRRAMTCQYMPDGATFNGVRCILTEEQLSRLTVGDMLDDELHNPLVFRK